MGLIFDYFHVYSLEHAMHAFSFMVFIGSGYLKDQSWNTTLAKPKPEER